MKRLVWLAALVVFVASPGLGQDVGEPRDLKAENQKKIDEARRQHEEMMAQYGWSAMAARLPGGYAFLDRLELTADQRKVLGEIYKEFQGKESESLKKVMKELPPLAPEDWKDAEKREAHGNKMKELREKHKVEPPVDQVRAVLTVEQMDALEAANQAVTEWTKWVQTALPEFERRLTEAVGPVPQKPDEVAFWCTQLERHLKGASQMPRLGLTDAMRQEIRRLTSFGAFGPTTSEWSKATWEMGKLQKVPAVSAQSLDEAIQAGRVASHHERVREELTKLLTAEQVQKLAKGGDIAEERDLAIVEHYRACVAKVNKALPGRETAPRGRFTDPGPQPQGVVEAVEAWNKWLETELPKFERRIDELLGPAPRTATNIELYEYSQLAFHVRGARLLPRLGLTDEQRAAIKKITDRRAVGDTYEQQAMSSRLVRAPDVAGFEPAINNALIAANQRPADAASPEEFVKKVLTAEQYAKLAAARLILDERDKAVWARYVQTVEAVQKALPAAPPPKDNPAEPVNDASVELPAFGSTLSAVTCDDAPAAAGTRAPLLGRSMDIYCGCPRASNAGASGRGIK